MNDSLFHMEENDCSFQKLKAENVFWFISVTFQKLTKIKSAWFILYLQIYEHQNFTNWSENIQNEDLKILSLRETKVSKRMGYSLCSQYTLADINSNWIIFLNFYFYP